MKRLAPVALVLLFGCATGATQVQRDEIQRTVPTCSSGADCDAKWKAAQVWITKNLRLRLQIATDVVLATNTGDEVSAYTAAYVTKEPLRGATYRILAKMSCPNLFRCFPPIGEATLGFNRYVNAASAPKD